MQRVEPSKAETIGMWGLAGATALGFHFLRARQRLISYAAQVALGAGACLAWSQDQAGKPSRPTAVLITAAGAAFIGCSILATRRNLADLIKAYSSRNLLAMESTFLGSCWSVGVTGLFGATFMHTGLSQHRQEGWALDRHARLHVEHAVSFEERLFERACGLFTQDKEARGIVLNGLVRKTLKREPNISDLFVEDWTISSVCRYWPDYTEEEKNYIRRSLERWEVDANKMAQALSKLGYQLEPTPPALFGVKPEEGAYATLLEILEISSETEGLAHRVQQRLDLIGLSGEEPAIIADLPDDPSQAADEAAMRLRQKVNTYKKFSRCASLPGFDAEGVEEEEDFDGNVDALVDLMLGRNASPGLALGALTVALWALCLALNFTYYTETALYAPRAAALGAGMGVLYAWSSRAETSAVQRIIAGKALIGREVDDPELVKLNVLADLLSIRADGLIEDPVSTFAGSAISIVGIGIWIFRARWRRLLGSVGVSVSLFALSSYLVSSLMERQSDFQGQALAEAKAILNRNGGARKVWQDRGMEGTLALLTAG